MWTDRQDKIQTFFGPGVQADIQKTEQVAQICTCQSCPCNCMPYTSWIWLLVSEAMFCCSLFMVSLWCICAHSNIVLFAVHHGGSSVVCQWQLLGLDVTSEVYMCHHVDTTHGTVCGLDV